MTPSNTDPLRRSYRPFWDPENNMGVPIPMAARAALFWGIATIIGLLIIVNRNGAIVDPLLGEAAVWGFMYAVYRLTRSGIATNERGIDIRRYWHRRIRMRWQVIDRFEIRSRSALGPALTIRLLDGIEVPTAITSSTAITSRTLEGLCDELNELVARSRTG